MKRKNKRAGTAIFDANRTLVQIVCGHTLFFELKPLDIVMFERVLFRDKQMAVFSNGCALYVVRDGGFRIKWKKR